MYDYANILFTGKCNLGCYECIGNNPALQKLPSNIREFPLKGIDALLSKVNTFNIRDLAFTGTNVDPQQYSHERELIGYVKGSLSAAQNSSTKLSLHTNGLLALRKIDVFNSYDKASVSLHSYTPETYKRMTKSGRIPDIKSIVEQARIPIKLSMLITQYNVSEIDDYIQQSAALGISRIVVRKIKGRDTEFPLETIEPFKDKGIKKIVFGWPVYELHGVEVTVCGFDSSTAKGVFLFSDGRLEDKLV